MSRHESIRRQRIAVIGAGIAGLGAAWALVTSSRPRLRLGAACSIHTRPSSPSLTAARTKAKSPTLSTACKLAACQGWATVAGAERDAARGSEAKLRTAAIPPVR